MDMKKIILVLAGICILNTTWGQVKKKETHGKKEKKATIMV